MREQDGVPDVRCLVRERLGRLVREVWVAWALEQPDPKPSWLAPWEDLSEPEREPHRRIGERLALEGFAIRPGSVETGYTRAQLAAAVDAAHEALHEWEQHGASEEVTRAHDALHAVGAGLPRVGCATPDPEAQRLYAEIVREREREMPCGHQILDLVYGGPDLDGRPAVVQCGACLTTRKAWDAEHRPPPAAGWSLRAERDLADALGVDWQRGDGLLAEVRRVRAERDRLSAVCKQQPTEADTPPGSVEAPPEYRDGAESLIELVQDVTRDVPSEDWDRLPSSDESEAHSQRAVRAGHAPGCIQDERLADWSCVPCCPVLDSEGVRADGVRAEAQDPWQRFS